MKANIVDLRYRMKEIIEALDRNETITVYYRGKEKATIAPVKNNSDKEPNIKAKNHPFFGQMNEESTMDVEKIMTELRKGRF